MTSSDHGAAEWLTGRAKPPMWFRLLGVLAFSSLTAGVAVKRGMVLGVVAAVFYSLPVLALVQWPPIMQWSKRHPLLESLSCVSFLFLFLTLITKLSAVICLLIAFLAGLPVVSLGAAKRHNRSRRP